MSGHYLFHQVVSKDGQINILATASTTIWPKADIVRRDYVKKVRFEAKGGASVKQQDAQRLRMANGFVKKRKKVDKKEALKRDLKKLLSTCKAKGISAKEIAQIVSETF